MELMVMGSLNVNIESNPIKILKNNDFFKTFARFLLVFSLCKTRFNLVLIYYLHKCNLE